MIDYLLSISRIKKKILIAVADSVIALSMVFVAFSLRHGGLYLSIEDIFPIILYTPILLIAVFTKFGLYSDIMRFIGINSIKTTFNAVTFYTIVWGLLTFLIFENSLPKSVIVIYWLLNLIFITGIRLVGKFYFENILNTKTLVSVLIYGAKKEGIQIAKALNSSDTYKIIGFIDSSKDLVRNFIDNIKVFPPEDIPMLIEKHEVKEILLSAEKISQEHKKQIMKFLEKSPVRLKVLPSINQIADGLMSRSDLKEMNIEDLLGREAIKPIGSLLLKNVKNKVVLITGAGGSIGSEIAKQTYNLGAKRIILFEQNEHSLYLIDRKISSRKVIPIIGSVNDKQRLESVFRKFDIDTVFHAAAYKHVPMVEFNSTEGIRNNIFGSLIVAKTAIKFKVKNFVLISTDKAVRPTNIMGATKRVAELIAQSLSQNNKEIKFSIVRFGNVLNSSGSVIPLFKRQIKEGGPITLTHKDIIRYFMTIPEAVQLVIQASSVGDSGDICILDMGEPVKIYDLAKRMIHLSGLMEKTKQNPHGDILIETIGLRPGEKLFEELLVSNKSMKTEHPMIMREVEAKIAWNELDRVLVKLEKSLLIYDLRKVMETLSELVPEYKINKKMVDYIHGIQ